jgi:hypothetical protein
MSQNALSVITRVKPDQVEALQALLDSVGNDIYGNPTLRFAEVTSTHFASMVLLNRDTRFPPSLVFESNHDGDQASHLDDLCNHAAAGLRAIYGKCVAYPEEADTDPAALKRYLVDNSVKTPAFYIGCYGQSIASIQNAMNTRQAIEDFLDAAQKDGSLRGQGQRQIYEKIQQHLRDQPVAPAYRPKQTHASIVRRSNVAKMAWILLAAGLLLKWPRPILIALGVFIVVLRFHEINDARTKGPTPLPIDPRLFGKEDIYTQNHLTTLVNVKPGAFRLGTLKGVLLLVNVLAKTVFIAGNLGGIPTIHFARWLLMDEDRRLLFFSNYDGSWASYLGDFVDKANYGLTAVWSNTENFPPAEFLFFGGARHIEAFKLWSRQHNEYASVWYSAYPDATVSNITDAVIIRDGLYGSHLSDADLAAWFKLL